MRYQVYKLDREFKNIYYFLKAEGFSENFISNLRKTWGNFLVNEKAVNIKEPLKIGDTLKINNNPNPKTTIMQCILPLDIVYEDKYYLLINKPSGISCMPNKKHCENNLAGAICNYMNDKDENFVLRIINRLDKDTSGLILVAKDSISQNKVTNINKSYYAVCEGIIDKPITINKPIKTVKNNGINNQIRVISPDGLEAVTNVLPISDNNGFSLIKLNLIHGRTHQIRVHLSSIDHPLLGDALYGNKSDLINHTALICKEMSFYHPYFQKQMEFFIDFPKDFKSIISLLKL